MPPKMTVKDLSMEVEKLKQSNVEKDALIKAQAEKISNLHQWAEELYSKFCTKSNEADQQHFNNAKILDQKIKNIEEKLGKFKQKENEETNEEIQSTVNNVKTV